MVNSPLVKLAFHGFVKELAEVLRQISMDLQCLDIARHLGWNIPMIDKIGCIREQVNI